MSFNIRFSREAASYLRRLPENQRNRILQRLDDLSSEPRNTRYGKPLRGGNGEWSSRVGGWRIIYIINDSAQAIDVLRIGPRGQVYRTL